MTLRTLMFAALVLLLAAGPAARAQNGDRALLEGAWMHHVTPGEGAPPNAGADTFVVYARGGITMEQNGAPGSGPSMGQWNRSDPSTFNATWLKPIYDPQSGKLAALLKIKAKITMISRDQYESSDTVDAYGPEGTLLLSWKATTKGRRILVEPLD